jgi:hypothetical protein
LRLNFLLIQFIVTFGAIIVTFGSLNPIIRAKFHYIDSFVIIVAIVITIIVSIIKELLLEEANILGIRLEVICINMGYFMGILGV